MFNEKEKNTDSTIYVGNLDDKCSEQILWELMVQAGPVANVTIPRDRITGISSGYAFVQFVSSEDSDYALQIMNMVRLYGKPLRINKATCDKTSLDIGATLFIGNLDISVDERTLTETFSAFGRVVQSRIVLDKDTAVPKGIAFVSFDNFESSDAAMENMNGRFLGSRPITVTYAFKNDGSLERHGTAAERLLAAQAKKNNVPLAPDADGKFNYPRVQI